MALTEEQVNAALNGEVKPASEASTEPKLTEEQVEAAMNSANILYGWGQGEQVNPDDFGFNLKTGDFDNFLYRAQDQGWGVQLGNAAARIVPNAALEIIGGVGSIFDFEDYLNQDNEVGNSLVRASNEGKEAINEAFPIYRERPGTSLDIGDSAWWFENGSGIVSSAAAFVGMGMGTGAVLSKGAQALQWVAKAGGMVRTAVRIRKASKLIIPGLNTLALNQAEGMLTATEIYDETLKRGIKQGLSQDEAKRIAAASASHSINVNRANILLNATSVAAITKGVNKGVTRQILKKEAMGRAVALESAQEYAEEVINLYAEKEGKRKADFDLLGKYYETKPTTWAERLSNTVFSIEGLEAGILGAVGGAAQTGFTHAGRNIAINGKSKNAELNERIQQQQSFISNLDGVLKSQGTKNFTTNSAGLDELRKSVEERNNLLALAEEYTKKGEEVPSKLATKILISGDAILTDQALANFQQGTTEYLESWYKDVQKATVEEAVAMGYTGEQLNENSPVHYSKMAERALTKIKEFEKIYQQHYAYKGLGSIMANRIAAKATIESIKEANIELDKLKTEAEEFNKTLPLYGNEFRVLVEDFDRVSKTGTPKAKRYITQAKKKRGLQPYLKAVERQKNIIKELKNLEKEYKKLISDEYQNKLKKIEEEIEKKEIEKQEKAVVKAKEDKDLAEIQDDTEDQAEAVNVPEASVNTPIEETSPEVEGHRGYVGPIVEISEEEAEKQAILEEIIGEVKRSYEEEIKKEVGISETEQREEIAEENAKYIEDIQESRDIAEGKSFDVKDQTTIKNNIVAIDEKLSSQNKTDNKASSVAYLAETILSKENTEIDPIVFNYNEVNVGTPVTLRVDTSYTGNVYYKGNEVPWQGLKSSLTEQELLEKTPIVIMVGDKTIGYVHDTEWFTLYNIGKGALEKSETEPSLKEKKIAEEKLAEEKERNRAIRKSVLEKGSINTTISYRGNGIIPTIEQGTKPVSEALPGIKIAVIKKNTLSDYEDLNILNRETITNGERVKDGYTVAIVPVNKNEVGEEQYIAYPLLRQKLNTKAKSSIVKATTILMKSLYYPKAISSEETKIADTIKELIDVDIRTIEGFEKYLTLFTHNTYPEGSGNLSQFMLTQNENKYAINVTSKGSAGVSFGKGGKQITKTTKNVIIPQMFKSNPDTYIEGLENIVEHLYANINDALLDADVTIPVITEENKVETLFSGKYTEYVKTYGLHTNATYHEIGTEENPKRVYTIQSVISYDDSFSGFIPKSNQNETVAATEKPDIDKETVLKEPFEPSEKVKKAPPGLEFMDDFDFTHLEDKNKDIESEELFAPYTGKTVSDYIIEGIPAHTQNLLIDNIIFNVLNTVENDDLVLSRVQEALSYLTEVKFPMIKSESWKLKELVRLRLQNLTNTVIQNEEESLDSTENKDEARSVEEKDQAWGIDILTINPKDSLSSRLKQLFSFIPLVNKEDGTPLRTKEGLIVFAGFDKTYEIVMSELSTNFDKDTPAPRTFDSMMDTLLAAKDIYTFLPFVVDRLKKAPRQLKNEFMVNADKHYTVMHHVWKKQTSDGKFYYNVLNDNANSRTLIIEQTWRNNNLQVSRISNNLLANGEVVEELKAEFDKWITKDKQIEDKKVLKWLSDMGITINQKTLDSFKEEDIYGLSYVKHFTTKEGIFKNIREALNSIKDGNELLETTLYRMSAFSRLAAQEGLNNSMYIPDSFRSGDSNIYGYQEQKWAVKRTSDLKYDEEELTRLAKNPITKNISWLKKLGKLDPSTGKFVIDKESRFYKNFSFGYVGLAALQEEGKFYANKKKLSELSSSAHEEVKKGFFENRALADKFGNRVVRFFFPTMSDKSTMFTLKVEPIKIAYDINGKLTKETIDALYDTILIPEINRMVNHIEGETNIKNYDQGAMMFYSVPELNNIPEIWNGTGSTRRLNLKVGRKGIEGDTVKKIIRENFEKHLNNLVEEQLKDWESLGLYNADTHVFRAGSEYKEYLDGLVYGEIGSSEREFNKAKLAAADFALNYMAANANFQVLYAGDAAQYYVGEPTFKENIKTEEGEFKKGDKIPVNHSLYYTTIAKNTFINIGKRLTLLAGPRRSPVFIEGKTTYRQGFVEDKRTASLAIDYISSIYEDNPEFIEKYKNIVGTDAVELITVSEKIEILYRDGKLDNTDYKRLLEIAKKGGDFSSSDLGKLKVFQADKPLYAGKAVEPNSLVERRIYIKSAAITLIPQFTRGLEIDKLRVLMENKKNPVNRIAFSSAVKVGNVKNPLNIWNEDGSIKENLSFSEDQILTLNRNEHGIQQDIPYKEKDSIKRVVQASKLSFVNLLNRDILVDSKKIKGRELYERFQKNWESLYSLAKEEFFEELEVDVSKDVWIPNSKKLSRYIKREAELRNLSLQDLEGLELREDGTFELPLWANGANKQFEALLNSLITNKILEQSIPGKAYVLASEEGFQKQVKTIEDVLEEQNIKDIESSGIVFTEFWNGKSLMPSIEGSNNQVFIPWPFKDVPMEHYIKDGKIDMSRIDADLFTMYGMRIPNQGPNSTGNLEIAGFLPEVMGDIIIAPRDFVTQMGSDFDVDKLYTYRYNYIVTDNGDIRRIKEEYLNPEKLKLRLSKAEKRLNEIILLDLKKDRQREKNLLYIQIEKLNKLLEPNALAKLKFQDDIVKIHRLLNADPSNFVQRQIKAPLGEGRLKEYSDIIENSKDSSFFSPYSSIYQRNKFKNASSGNKAIGVFAIANTFNASAQTVEGPLKIVDGDKDLYVRFGNQVSYGVLNNELALDNKTYISENISNYLSVAVDNEKIQALHNLNINDVTYGIVNLLTQLGFTHDVISSFLGQDILFELVKKVEEFQDKGESSISALNKAFSVLEKDSKYSEKVFDALDEDNKNKILKKYADSSSAFLFEVIKKGEDHPDYKITQKAILKKFKFLSKKAVSLQNLQRITNIDSSGIGKNLIESKVKEEAFVEALTDKNIIGASKLFGEISYTPLKGYQQFGNIYFKPTSISGFAVIYGVIPNNRLWNQSRYFPYTDKAINDVVKTIIDISNIREFDEYQNVSIESRIFNAIKSYYFSNLGELGFVDTSLQKDTGRLVRYNLLSEEGVLQNIIAKYSNTSLFINNPFLNKLSIRKRKAGTPGSINFSSRDTDVVSKHNIYGGLIKLLNSTKELPEQIQINNDKVKLITEQDLARALIVSQYATGGIQKYTQFLRYIPLDYLKKIGFTESARNLDFAKLLNEGRGNNKFQLPYMVIQFFQHNPYLLNTPEVSIREFVTKDAEKEEDITRFSVPLPLNKAKIEDPTLLDPMVKLKGENKDHVFLFDGNEYIRLDNLGSVDFNEYQSKEITRSVIYNNIAKDKKGVPVSYYDQVAANTPKKPIINKADQLNHITLDQKYGFNEAEPTISKTLMAISNNGPTAHRALAEDYLQVFKDGEYKLVIDRNLPAKGRHIRSEKTVFINPDLLTGDEDYSKTFLHEVTHMLTVEVLENPVTEQQKKAKASLTRLLNAYRKTLKSGELELVKKQVSEAKEKGVSPKLTEEQLVRVYPAINLKEFVAGFMTDVKVQNHLNKVDFNENTTYGQEYEKRLLKILNSIKGFELTSTSAQAIREVIALIDYQDEVKLNPVVLAKMENSTSNSVDANSRVRKKSIKHTEEDVGIKSSIAQAEANFLEDNYENMITSAINKAVDRMAPIDENNIPPEPTTFEDLPAATKKEKDEEAPISDLVHPSIKNKQAILKALNKKVNRDKKRMHDSTDPKVGVYYENRIIRTKEKIAEIEEQIAAITGMNTYSTTLKIAEEDLSYVDTLVSSDIRLITSEDMEIVDSIITLWKNFKKEEFVEKIYSSLDTEKDFNNIKNKAESLEDKLHDIAIEKTKSFIKRELPKATSEDIKNLMAISDDIGVASSYIYDLSRVDNVIAQAMSKSILRTNDYITEEVTKVAEEIDPILQNAEKALKKLGLTFDVFMQKDEKDRYTGRIIMPYSQKFFNLLKANSEKAFSPEASKEDRQAYREWRKLTQITINPSKLEDKKYVETLIKEVGNENIEYIKKQAIRRQEYYNKALEREQIRIDTNPDLSKEEKKQAIKKWAEENKFKYQISIPRKINTRGEPTGFYDSKFEIIQNNPDLKVFHEYTIDLLSKLGKYSTNKRTPVNSIPLMQKEFWEAAKGKDSQGIFNLMADAMKKGLRAKGAYEDYITEITSGKRTLSNNFNEVTKRQLADRLVVKELQYKQKTNKNPTKTQIKEWKADIMDELTKESSLDIGKILKTYAATAIAYKHKSQVETPLRIAEKLLKEVKAAERSSSGAIINDLVNKGIDEQGLININNMVTSTLNHWFGVKKPEKINKKSKVKYTSEEKKTKIKLDKIIATAKENIEKLNKSLKNASITEDRYIKKIAVEQNAIDTAQKQLDKLGGVISKERIFKGTMRYMQLLGMGWNAVAGIANLGFGLISNTNEGIGGEYYTTKEFFNALGDVIKGTLFGIKTEDGKKQSILMKRWGILQKSSQETFKRKTATNKLLNFLNPYKIQDTTEYLNQAPIMVLMQKKTPVLDSKGEPVVINGTKINFYNAYDKDGNWKTGILGEEKNYQKQKDDLRILIGDLIARNHGNYNNEGRHLMVKDSLIGQSLTQFRTWMLEGIGNRFREEYFDRITGTIKKGRYVTIYEDWERAAKLLYSAKTWKELSIVDRANVRKTLADIGMLLSFMGFVTLLKGAAEDEDDEDKLAVLHLLINIGLRMQTDIAFYVNPMEAERLTQSTIPVASLVSRASGLTQAMYKYIMDEDEITNGIYAGESNLLHKGFNSIPFGKAILQVHKTATRPFR